MGKKVASEIMLTLLLASMLYVVFDMPIAEATGTIYIRPGGSIDPPWANITTADKVIYNFTDNNYDEIVIERNNIVVDGKGYTVQGTGIGRGINLIWRTNVTLKNLEIKKFDYGVWLDESDNCSIVGNNITDNAIYGIFMSYSSEHDGIVGNSIASNAGSGIWLDGSLGGPSNYHSIVGNNIANNEGYGIYIASSSNNSISRNILTNNNKSGIRLWLASTNSLVENNITNNVGSGILLDSSTTNSVVENNLTNNANYGILLDSSTNNTLSGNSMANNKLNFGVDGKYLSDFVNNVTTSNTVDGKPIYYWVNKQNVPVPLDAGYVALVNCTSTIVENLNLAKNGQGILLVDTTNSTITKNNITNNSLGIWLYESSSYNNLIENIIASNNGSGITVFSSNNNSISGNNITANKESGMRLQGSSNNGIVGNSIASNAGSGIWLDGSSNYNSVSGNNITTNSNDGVYIASSSNYNGIFGNIISSNDGPGIYITASNYNSVSDNDIKNNLNYGIDISFSSARNSVSGNNITENDRGIGLWSSSYNNISGNDISNNNGTGFYISNSNNNSIFGNDISNNNGTGIRVSWSSSNVLSSNDMAKNKLNFGVDGTYLPDFVNNVTTSNTVDGKPIYYWVNKQGGKVPANASYVALVNCTSTIVENLNLTKNGQGLLLVATNNSRITNNTIINNGAGIRLFFSSGNTIYYNKFIMNTIQVYSYQSVNVWSNFYPFGGNYWSDYNGTDLYRGPYQNVTGSDGIGDKKLIIDAQNEDGYPLMNPYPSIHAIKVQKVTISKAVIGQGFSENVSVALTNQGHFTETVNVSVNFTVNSNTTSMSKRVTVLPGQPKSITFTWNTSGFAKGNYTISAVADVVPGEIDTTDNTLTDGIILVAIVDLNADHKVNIKDIAIVAKAFGSTPGSPTWNPIADVDGNGKIEIKDIAKVAIYMWRTVP